MASKTVTRSIRHTIYKYLNRKSQLIEPSLVQSLKFVGQSCEFCILFSELHMTRSTQIMDGDSESQIELKGSPSKTKHLIKDFCNYTTTHGVGRLAEAKTIFSRFIWSIFILGSLSMFIYQTSSLFGLYLSRPISTVVKVKHETVSQNKSVVINWLCRNHSSKTS